MDSIPADLLASELSVEKSTHKISNTFAVIKQREKRSNELLKLIKMFPDEEWNFSIINESKLDL